MPNRGSVRPRPRYRILLHSSDGLFHPQRRWWFLWLYIIDETAPGQPHARFYDIASAKAFIILYREKARMGGRKRRTVIETFEE